MKGAWTIVNSRTPHQSQPEILLSVVQASKAPILSIRPLDFEDDLFVALGFTRETIDRWAFRGY